MIQKSSLIIPRVVPRDVFDFFLTRVMQSYPNTALIILEANEIFLNSYDEGLLVLHHVQSSFTPISIESLLLNDLGSCQVNVIVPYMEHNYLELKSLFSLADRIKGTVSFLSESGKYLTDDQMREMSCAALQRLSHDKEKLRSLKTKYAGKRCFVLGNGPSLNDIDFSLLRNEYTFGANGIYLAYSRTKCPMSFFTIEDELFARNRGNEVKEQTANIFCFFPLRLYPFFKHINKAIFLDYAPPTQTKRPFSLDASEKVHSGYTVVYLNLQLAWYLGFEEVYLLGVDLSYKSQDQSKELLKTADGKSNHHFIRDYHKKGHLVWQPDVEQMEVSLRKAKTVFENSGRKIFSASKRGNRKILQEIGFSSLF